MKPEIKAKWLEALRSGEYEQGKYVLRSGSDKFCCLGVLCDLYAKERKDVQWNMISGYGHYTIGTMASCLPQEVSTWADIGKSMPFLRAEDGERLSAAFLNDTRELNFNQIADLIEDQM